MQASFDATSLNGPLADARNVLERISACIGRPLLATAGAVLLVGFSISTVCAQPSVNIADGPELRTLYANSADISEGKHIAQSICAGCHGEDGISQSPGVPNLAGQRAAYLYLELKAYQSGVRGDGTMKNVVGPLNDDALFKASAYFASLDPAEPAGGAKAAAVDPVQVGKTAAAACAGCHGEGSSSIPGTPSLSGQDPKFLVAAINAYKSGARKNETMAAMVAGIDDAAANNIALYYGLQKPERTQIPAEGDKTAGSAASAACAGCHGADGVSTNPAFPSLAGQDASYVVAALQDYKQGTRSDETMKGLAATLDDAAMKNVAAFYAGLEPKQPNVRKPLSPEEWAQRCDRCHGLNGNSDDPRLPALAAQRQDYLEKVLQDYRTGARKSPQMAAMSDVLTEQDISNLAAYYAHQKARGVVFVILPPKSSAK